jgi:hypothetical protein
MAVLHHAYPEQLLVGKGLTHLPFELGLESTLSSWVQGQVGGAALLSSVARRGTY